MITPQKLKTLKQKQQKFCAITSYDATFTQIINEVGIDVILVGDSLGNVIQGHDTTVPVTIEQMIYHTQCVAKTNNNALLLSDLPYMSYVNPTLALKNAVRLMQAGSHMVKMEGGVWLIPIIEQLTERGIPVCAHLGLTPQTVHSLGGYNIQGRDLKSAQDITKSSKQLQDAGASMLVLECVPQDLASDITGQLDIPVIGIGAGNGTDGQILVLHDMLGLTPKAPKFVKNFMAGSNSIKEAIAMYKQEVTTGVFPAQEHSF